MANYTMYQGSKFYLIDDCDSLLTKFYNQRDEILLGSSTWKQLIQIEAKIEKLETAMAERDTKTMQLILDEHRTMFKRYR